MKRAALYSLTLSTLVTLSATAVQARDWKPLCNDATHNYVMYDKKTTKRQGDVVSGWVSKQYNVDEAAMKEKQLPVTKYYGNTWTLAFYEFDCKKGEMRAMVGKENLGGKRIDELSREKFKAPAAGSIDELTLQSICKEVK